MNESPRRRPVDFVLSAPSGAGKTTLAKKLLAASRDLARTVSCTTRSRRAGEVDGRDYFFVSETEFESQRANGDFLEWAVVHDCLYGTLHGELERIHQADQDAIMVIDVQGAASVAQKLEEVATIFVMPPSPAVLRQRLLERDGSEAETCDAIRRRLSVAAHEIGQYLGYDYLVINEDLDHAVDELRCIVEARRCCRESRRPLAEAILRAFRPLDP